MTTDHDAPQVIDLYQRHGAAWAALRTTRLVERAWLDRFCALVPEGGAILDIGCGTGVPIARALVSRGFAVTGIDGAPAMVAAFRANLPGVATVRCDMRRMALDRRFAGLLAWDSMFHLSPDAQRAMFGRFADHALPGAPLMFTSGDAAGVTPGDLNGEPLYHASLDPEDYRRLLAAAGFAVVAHRARDPRCGDRTIWLARRS